MTATAAIAFAAAFGMLNRARGSQIFGLVPSTAAGRLVSTFLMAYSTALLAGGDALRTNLVLLWAWPALYLWTVFAWDNYWSAAIGHAFDAGARTFPPADRLLKRMPWFAPVYSATASDVRRRLWGATAMGLRQSLAAPCVAGLALLAGHPEHGWYAAGTLLLGLPYLIAGYACKTYPVGSAEYLAGGCLGLLAYLATH